MRLLYEGNVKKAHRGGGTQPSEEPDSLTKATYRLNRLLAEFRLAGGFGGREGLRVWGEIQRTVREIDRLRGAASSS